MRWPTSAGVAGFVLKYRVAPYKHPVPLEDAQRAVTDSSQCPRPRSGASIRSTDRHLGFSAGGHLASTAATHFDDGKADADDPIERVGCRPDFAISCYPVITLKPPLPHMGSRAQPARRRRGRKARGKSVQRKTSDGQDAADVSVSHQPTTARAGGEQHSLLRNAAKGRVRRRNCMSMNTARTASA